MSENGDEDRPKGNKTVFRPSPLAGMRQGKDREQERPTGQEDNQPPPPTQAPQSPIEYGAPPQFGHQPPPTPAQPTPQAVAFTDAPAPGYLSPEQEGMRPAGRLNDDDIPRPSRQRELRSALVMEAAPILALAASVRSGRANISMPAFHREASEAIAAYDRAIIPLYPDETRQRARYALCATVDDIAQNLPNIGQDGSEWARRSLVIMFFRENIGGDRFWQLVDQLLQRPAENAELIELYADCLAAGFEGRFRVMPDGKARLQQIMSSLYGALEHPRSQPKLELSPRWKGLDAPLGNVSPKHKIMLAAAAALAFLVLLYVILRLLLMSSGSDPWEGVRALTPEEPLRLSRVGSAPPPAASSAQSSRLKRFLAPEIRQGLVAVEEDAKTVRVRTTVGTLFESGSDELTPGREPLFRRIGRAVEEEPGAVTIEGHADSDQVSSLSFPDNTALSRARAERVAAIVGSQLSNPGRIRIEGFGDSRPIAGNDTDVGKAKNRRVEIVVPRRN